MNTTNGRVAWRKHLHRDLGTSKLTGATSSVKYLGTASTAEGDLLEAMLEDFEKEGNSITHLTIDGDQEYVVHL